jgi:hypothetical protein
MVTAYSPILKLALPVQGELSGTWGDVVNDNITSMVEQAIAGRAVIDTWTTNSHVLTTANGTTSESRCAMLEFTDTGTALSGAGTVTCPTLSKIYIAKNASGQNVTLKTSGGTGILVPNGRTMFLFCDGTNVVEAVTSTTSLQLGTSTIVTAVLDEDNMASDSATSLATQQSIKAYVDSQVGANNELSEVLANGNTTGATDIAVDSAQKVQFRDAAIYINSSVDGQLDIVADTEIQIAATTIDVNGALDVSGTALVTGVLTTTAATVSNGGGQFNGAINVGVDDTGYDVKFFGATTGKSLLWDESADSLIVTGTTTLVGTTNLDAVDIDGATQIDATVTVGVDDTGYDVKFFGATAGAYMLWDESADDLILGGAAGLSVNSTALVTGVLTTTAATVHTGGITMPDNAKAIFGAGSDLQIYHDGTQNYIEDAGTGNLNFKSNGNNFNFLDGSDNVVMQIDIDSATTLYHNTSAKLATTATGIDVTGTVVADGLTVGGQMLSTATSGASFKNITPTTGTNYLWLGNAGNNLYVGKESSTGGTLFVGSSSYAAVIGNDGAYPLQFATNNNVRAVIDSSGNVGIGTSSPVTLKSATTLQVSGNAKLGDDNGRGLLSLGDIASTGANAGIWRGAAGAYAGTGNYLNLGGYDGITFTTGAADISAQTERMRINSSGGLITKPAAGGHAVFNEDGIDADFRVESATTANALFVEGSSGYVGIGTSSPLTTLHVNSTYGTGYTGAFSGVSSYNPTSSEMLIGTLLGSAASAGDYTGLRFNINGNGSGVASASIIASREAAEGNGNTSLSFLTRTTTSSLTERMNITSAGNVNITGGNLDVVGQVTATGGAVSAPTYSFIGDTDTGISRPTTNAVNIVTAGTERLRIDSSGGLITKPEAGGHAVFNENGVDADFRVASDGNVNMLFVDGGANHVNIGTATNLGSTFNVSGSTAMNGGASGATTASGATLSIQGTGTYNSDYFGSSLATVAIRSNKPANNLFNPTLHLTTIRQSLGTNQNSTGGIGFTTVDDSNSTGIDDAARIQVINLAPSSTTSSTGLVFYNNVGGSKTQAAQAVFKLAPTEAVFNEDSADIDFRVESDGNGNMLFVDAEYNAVGIGNAAPRAPLDIRSTIGAHALVAGFIRVTSNDAVDILTVSGQPTNAGVAIYARLVAASAVSDDAAVIEFWAALNRQSSGADTATAVAPVVSKAIVGTAIGAGSLAWSGKILQYTPACTTNYVGYQMEIQVVTNDATTITINAVI